MTRRPLVTPPAGLDATRVACPVCFAYAGWACGLAHGDGYHRARILAARVAPVRGSRR